MSEYRSLSELIEDVTTALADEDGEFVAEKAAGILCRNVEYLGGGEFEIGESKADEGEVSTIRFLLDQPNFIPTLIPMTGYRRVQDDCDGDFGQQLLVLMGVDGDMHISVLGENKSLRFRNWSGGGKSLRVHSALMILAEAIRLDSEEFPQFPINNSQTGEKHE